MCYQMPSGVSALSFLQSESIQNSNLDENLSLAAGDFCQIQMAELLYIVLIPTYTCFSTYEFLRWIGFTYYLDGAPSQWLGRARDER